MPVASPVSGFQYEHRALTCDGVPLAAIAAEVGTPVYVYSAASIRRAYQAFACAFASYPHALHYALKANSTLALARLVRELGAGADANSGGEIDVALRAGFTPDRIVFTGVGKTRDEIDKAVALGLRAINAESAGELWRIDAAARARGTRARVALRINPDIDARSHPHISTGLKESKFGIAMEHARAAYHVARALSHLRVVGVDCHIGSQLTELAPFEDSIERVLALVDGLAADGIVLQHLDLGGGLGIRYRDEQPPTPEEYIKAMLKAIDRQDGKYRHLKLLIEPGRAVVGNAGLLVTRVQYLKHHDTKNFAIVDAAMNDLMRPALYDAWQDIIPARQRDGATQRYDVVGPVCESGDFLGRDRDLRVEAGDLLAICSAGAYGSSMSSNYNTRPRVPEIMVANGRFHEVRRRETLEEMLLSESLLPD